jgi:hypothetical protein
MAHYAQTHLQLYRQLQEASYREEDLILVDRAYRIGMRRFAGNYRPNNKPFLMHLVGVASILVNVRQPADVIAAGLLHSAYLGLGKNGLVNRIHRKRMAESVGQKVEQLIYDYSNRHWSVEDFSVFDEDLQPVKPEDRQLYLIKFADIHEEFVDGGNLYQPGKKLLSDQDKNQCWLQDVCKGIAALGYESWAQEFQMAVGSNELNVPDAIRGKASSSYFQAPGLFNSKFKNRLIRWLARNELRF